MNPGGKCRPGLPGGRSGGKPRGRRGKRPKIKKKDLGYFSVFIQGEVSSNKSFV